jgi:hypothetical protein
MPQLVVTNVPTSLIISTLMMEAIGSSELSVLIRTTRGHILEDGILQGKKQTNKNKLRGP